MDLHIRPIVQTDLPSLLELMREFAAFEHLDDQLAATEERLHRAMFADGAFVHGLLACDNQKPVGYALFFPSFASFRAEPGMYLEDLYIRESHRRSGVGRDMLRGIARVAAARGFERIDFLVLDWNVKAVDFYKRLGADMNDDERHFKIAGPAFDALTA